MCDANDEPLGQSKIAVQAPISGDTWSSFQRMPPFENASGNGFHGSASICTYSSLTFCFMALSSLQRRSVYDGCAPAVYRAEPVSQLPPRGMAATSSPAFLTVRRETFRVLR